MFISNNMAILALMKIFIVICIVLFIFTLYQVVTKEHISLFSTIILSLLIIVGAMSLWG